MNRKERRATQKKLKRSLGPSSSSSTVDFLYRVALGHYQAARLDEAERVCQEIVADHPEHADSLNLLGLIAHQTGRIELATQLVAKAIIKEPRSSSFHYSAGLVLHASARLPEAVAYYSKAVALDPNSLQPRLALANVYVEQGRLDEAALECEHAIRINPAHAPAFFLFGNVLQLQDRLQPAIAKYQQALKLAPDFPELHNNLGNALRQQGKLKEAITHFSESVRLKPDNPEAWNNFGLGLQQQALVPEAIEAYERALAIRPTMVAALQNSAAALLVQGKVELALSRSLRALEVAETPESKALFGRCGRRIGPQHLIPQADKVASALVRALREPWGRPSDLGYLGVRLLELNPDVHVHIERACLAPNAYVDLSSLSAVYDNELLHALLLAAPVSDLRLERFLTIARREILEVAIKSKQSDSQGLSFIQFVAALAQQCFINEYIFNCEDDELVKANDLRELLITALRSNEPVSELCIAALSAYFPLYSLSSQLDRAKSWSASIAALVVQQVVEPRNEQGYRDNIPQLTEINNEISIMVRGQYEQNPYPRWVKTSPQAPTNLGKLMRTLFPHVSLQHFDRKLDLEILIAGCGTGQHSIETADRFPQSRILAVDLSLASLCYASRKTFEAGLTNIRYAQADILNLHSSNLEFDLIEATGILHHLEDTNLGWRSLSRLLRTGGVMRLGLYSKLARRKIARAQDFVMRYGFASTPHGIRSFRRQLSVLDESILNDLATTTDFYSVSGCRDALFNVKEHQTDLLAINRIITENQLEFLGFSIDESVIHSFRQRFPGNAEANDLLLWHRFEEENPDTFIRMYQFWIRKPG